MKYKSSVFSVDNFLRKKFCSLNVASLYSLREIIVTASEIYFVWSPPGYFRRLKLTQ